MAIPVIDIFAGPGGLGEGFSALSGDNNVQKFKISLSIEKDPYAHSTLELRSFFRQFPIGKVHDDYYRFLRGNISREQLFELHQKEAGAAKREAWLAELGDGPHATSERIIDKRIKESLDGAEEWVLIGGPPCQAYSLVGRSRNQGIDPNDPRVYLYRAYYRILAEHNPPVFIMENVKGLLSSKINNAHIFDEILDDLRDPAKAYKKLKGKRKYKRHGYDIYSLVRKPRYFENGTPHNDSIDYIIKSEDYGIPQARHRVLLIGIRKDLGFKEIPLLKKQEKRHSVKDAIDGLPKLRSGLSKQKDNSKQWLNIVKETLNIGIAAYARQQELLDAKVAEPQPRYFADFYLSRGDSFLPFQPTISFEQDWFLDEKIQGVCNHETRSHIEDDIRRYVFTSLYGQAQKRSPKLSEFPKKLLPKHKNVEKAIKQSLFGDRFRVQLANKPATTVTSHISKDGHYYIHYDPTQARSLTVREAARLQTFPDNYFFCGPRTQQYHQVGNAVPPLLANQIAGIISEVFEGIADRSDQKIKINEPVTVEQ